MSTRKVHFRGGSWSDEVGSAMTRAADGVVKNFNDALSTMWHNIDACQNIDPKQYTYESQKERIWAMKVELR